MTPLDTPEPEQKPKQAPTESSAHPRPGHPFFSRFATLGVMLGLFVIFSNSFHAIAYLRKHVGVSASALVTLRYGPVVPFCLIYCALRWRQFRALMADRGWVVLLMGLLMVPAYNLALNWGQGRVPPATASLIITMNPVFTYLLALAFLGERARWSKFLGLAVAFLGVYGLVAAQGRSFGSGYALYAVVVLIGPLSWACSTVLGKPLTRRHDPVLLTFAATGLGSLPFFFTLIAGTGGVHAILRTMNPTAWVALLHLTLLCTIVGFAVWFWALRHLSASTVAAFVFLNPPLTAIFGAIWGTERFDWRTAAYGSVVLAGVALSTGILRQRRADTGASS
jgi:drug/metabolite transporter (DMT)-like permease